MRLIPDIIIYVIWSLDVVLGGVVGVTLNFAISILCLIGVSQSVSHARVLHGLEGCAVVSLTLTKLCLSRHSLATACEGEWIGTHWSPQGMVHGLLLSYSIACLLYANSIQLVGPMSLHWLQGMHGGWYRLVINAGESADEKSRDALSG